ncbi:MAG TPA: cupin domain-containing protein [Plantibacter sp.]|uniref:cupin domain-containing protein n=1 Tax=unclassified Plantibacter TaxID=2624265 RepID=UPI002B8D56F3|nr:cupin domain-containing protein [Plantibacter sp.]
MSAAGPQRPRPGFPGGTGITRLAVWDGVSVDGLVGGTPHLHTVSTEGYVVTAGSGVAQTIDRAGFRETPLEVGTVLWFPPGTVHRAINHGGLEIVVVMSNSGLPEAGDAVMTFTDEILADPAREAEVGSPPAADADDAEAADRITERRDAAVHGFLELRAAVATEGPVAWDRFAARAAALVRPRIAHWRAHWEATVLPTVEDTRTQLDLLERGDASGIGSHPVAVAAPAPGERRRGMCGLIRAYDVHPDHGEIDDELPTTSRKDTVP